MTPCRLTWVMLSSVVGTTPACKVSFRSGGIVVRIIPLCLSVQAVISGHQELFARMCRVCRFSYHELCASASDRCRNSN